MTNLHDEDERIPLSTGLPARDDKLALTHHRQAIRLFQAQRRKMEKLQEDVSWEPLKRRTIVLTTGHDDGENVVSSKFRRQRYRVGGSYCELVATL